MSKNLAEGYSDVVIRTPPTHFRLMIIGASGTGKTSIINSFFGVPLSEKGSKYESKGSTTGIHDLDPFEIPIGANKQRYIFHLIDTPGHGDHFDSRTNFCNLMQDIERRFEQRHLDTLKDSSVDCIWYFLHPERLMEPDIKMMKALSRVTTVIPIIGKADSMNPIDKITWQKEVYDYLIKGKNPDGTTAPQIFDSSLSFYKDKDKIYALMGSNKGFSRWYGNQDPKELNLDKIKPEHEISVVDDKFSDNQEFQKHFFSELNTIKQQKKSEFYREWMKENTFIVGGVKVYHAPFTKRLSLVKYIILGIIMSFTAIVVIKEFSSVLTYHPTPIVPLIALAVLIGAVWGWFHLEKKDESMLEKKYS